MLIEARDSLLLVVDIQTKLAPAIHEGPQAIANNARLLAAARQLKIPVAVSEQYVRGLGPTVPELQEYLTEADVFEKTHFSCAREPGVIDRLRAKGRRQIIVTGMETHVCVLQSVLGLIDAGFQLFVVQDAAASRTPENRIAEIGRASWRERV